MQFLNRRKAIAMIELIFAIVILGIVMMSAPMLIATANKSGYVALQQESIAAAASEISMILTYHWDENNTDENLSSPILQTTAGDTNLNETTDGAGNSLRVRAGSSTSSTRTFVTSTNERLDASSVLGSDGDNDDIDDFIGTSNLSDVNTTTTASGDYIDNAIVLTTAVDYIGDSPTTGNYLNSDGSIAFDIASDGAGVTGTTNIKKVTLTLTTTNTQSELAKTIILRAFSCNVGTYELEERDY